MRLLTWLRGLWAGAEGVTRCEHRFPVYGNHRCRKCGAEPEGLTAEVLALYDEPT